MRRDRSKAYRKIAQLEKSIKEKERVIARYKKRMQRDRKRKEKVKGSKDVLLHNVLLQGIQSSMNGQIDERGRHVVGQLMPTEELKRNKLARKYSRETGISRRRLGKKMLKLGDYAKEGRTVIWRINMKRKIEQFLRRDINSTVAPGKRDTITRKGLKKQKRYLNDSLKSLHERFVKENTDNKVSYPTFCKFRPFYIVEMKAGDRNTCLCKLHENMRFKVEKLHQLKLIETKNHCAVIMD